MVFTGVRSSIEICAFCKDWTAVVIAPVTAGKISVLRVLSLENELLTYLMAFIAHFRQNQGRSLNSLNEAKALERFYHIFSKTHT